MKLCKKPKSVIMFYAIVLLMACSLVPAGVVQAAAKKPKTVTIKSIKTKYLPDQPEWTYEEGTKYNFKPKFTKKSNTSYTAKVYEDTEVKINLNNANTWTDIKVTGTGEYTFVDVNTKKNFVNILFRLPGYASTSEVSTEKFFADGKATIKLTPVVKNKKGKVTKKGKTITIKAEILRNDSLYKEFEKLLIAETPYNLEDDFTLAQKKRIVTGWIGANTFTDNTVEGEWEGVDTLVKAITVRRHQCIRRAELETALFRTVGIPAYVYCTPGHARTHYYVDGKSLTLEDFNNLIDADSADEWYHSVYDQFLRTVNDESDAFIPAFTETWEYNRYRYEMYNETEDEIWCR